MGSADGAPVAEPTFNPELAPTAEAETSAEIVPSLANEPVDYMIPGMPNPEYQAPSENVVPVAALPEPESVVEASPQLDAISSPSAPVTPESLPAPVVAPPELPVHEPAPLASEPVVAREAAAPATPQSAALPEVSVKIEHKPSESRSSVREIKDISDPAHVLKAKLSELPAGLEERVGKKL